MSIHSVTIWSFDSAEWKDFLPFLQVPVIAVPLQAHEQNLGPCGPIHIYDRLLTDCLPAATSPPHGLILLHFLLHGAPLLFWPGPFFMQVQLWFFLCLAKGIHSQTSQRFHSHPSQGLPSWKKLGMWKKTPTALAQKENPTFLHMLVFFCERRPGWSTKGGPGYSAREVKAAPVLKKKKGSMKESPSQYSSDAWCTRQGSNVAAGMWVADGWSSRVGRGGSPLLYQGLGL